MGHWARTAAGGVLGGEPGERTTPAGPARHPRHRSVHEPGIGSLSACSAATRGELGASGHGVTPPSHCDSPSRCRAMPVQEWVSCQPFAKLASGELVSGALTQHAHACNVAGSDPGPRHFLLQLLGTCWHEATGPPSHRACPRQGSVAMLRQAFCTLSTMASARYPAFARFSPARLMRPSLVMKTCHCIRGQGRGGLWGTSQAEAARSSAGIPRPEAAGLRCLIPRHTPPSAPPPSATPCWSCFPLAAGTAR